MSCFFRAAMTSVLPRFSRTRAFSPTILNVAWMPAASASRQPLRRVVILWQDVVLGVEPEGDVDGRWGLSKRDGCRGEDQ